MGYYIEAPTSKGKAEWLIREHGAREIKTPEFDMTRNEVTICVVDNGPFEAAGIAYDVEELLRMLRPDSVGPSTKEEKDGMTVFHMRSPKQRPRRWLILSREKVIELCPIMKDILPKPTAIRSS